MGSWKIQTSFSDDQIDIKNFKLVQKDFLFNYKKRRVADAFYAMLNLYVVNRKESLIIYLNWTT